MEGVRGSRSRRGRHGECDRRRSRAPEVRAREEERGRTARTEIQKSTHDDGTSIMKCFINAINLIKKFRTRIPLDQIGPIKGKKIRSKIPLGLKRPNYSHPLDRPYNTCALVYYNAP